MAIAQSIRHVPWTCRWGRFGGPVMVAEKGTPGFLFWVCGHPDSQAHRALDRQTCRECHRWEPAEILGGDR